MKLRTKLIIAFLTVLLLPIILGSAMIYLVGSYQISAIEKTYQISGTTVESLSNSMQTLSSLTEPVLCVQRQLPRPDGTVIEPQEFPLPALPGPAAELLPLLGARLLRLPQTADPFLW